MTGFTEFCCRSGGSNMNGGGIASNGEPATSPVYSSTNGNWNGTSSFTPTDGSTPASTVTAGDFAHVFVDAATTPTYIARVTAVAGGVNGAITLSTTLKCGTAPSSSATTRSIRVGGAWLGPNGAVGFPFTFMDGSLFDGSNRGRVNLKNDQTYNITAMMDINPASGSCYVTFQGYTTTFGDLGRSVIDGGTSGAAYSLIRCNSNAYNLNLVDLIFDHNGATGNVSLVEHWRGNSLVLRCTFRNSRGYGHEAQYGSGYSLVECDAYLNLYTGFFHAVTGVNYYRCISSRNSNHGFAGLSGFPGAYVECIAVGNTLDGFNLANAANMAIGCEAYLNGQDGIFFGWGSPSVLVNCNAVKNGRYGISGFTVGGAMGPYGIMNNCGFGGGGDANTSGATTALDATVVIGSANYTSQPWTDPANGDFRISSSQSKGLGFGVFQWSDTNYSARANNVAYPDIGAVQHQDAGGSTGPIGQLKQFNRGTPY